MKKSNILALTASPLLLTLPLNAAISVVGGLESGAHFSNASLAENGFSGDGSSRLGAGGNPIKGNSFVVTSNLGIAGVTFRIDEDAANLVDATGTITLEFFNLNAAPDDAQNSTGIPTGAALTSQLETLPAVSAGDYVTITLDSALNLTPGNYAFALTGSGLDLHIDINTGGNTTFTPGEIVRSNGSTWASRNFDLVFSVNAIPEPSSGLLAVVASLALLRRRRVAS